MKGFKSLPIAGLVLAMLTSSAQSTPDMGPSYGMAPVHADVQDEVQQQQLMANEPEASVQAAICYNSLYVLAFTSGFTNAGTGDRAYVQIWKTNELPQKVRLYNHPGDAFTQYKGDLWKISLSAFGFSDTCITRQEIFKLVLLAGGNDGWNIESIVTFLKSGSNFLLLSQDFNVYHWLDANALPANERFELNLV